MCKNLDSPHPLTPSPIFGNTARLRKIVGWVEALRNPTEPTREQREKVRSGFGSQLHPYILNKT
jgi:hypothetical protein